MFPFPIELISKVKEQKDDELTQYNKKNLPGHSTREMEICWLDLVSVRLFFLFKGHNRNIRPVVSFFLKFNCAINK